MLYDLSETGLACPACDEMGLEQVRVRVFPFAHPDLPLGATIVEQTTGSALTLREEDLIHPRPEGAGRHPAVTIVFTCIHCTKEPGQTVELHIYNDVHGSCVVWDVDDFGPGLDA